MASYGSSSRREKENQLIWWPPGPVIELARLAFDSGGDADSVHRALDPSIIPVSLGFTEFVCLDVEFQFFS